MVNICLDLILQPDLSISSFLSYSSPFITSITRKIIKQNLPRICDKILNIEFNVYDL